MSGTDRDFHFLRESLPDGATYSVAGMGRFEFSLAEASIIAGGHVRVGIEDNIYLEKGVLTKGSYELVEKVVTLAKKHNRSIASPSDARRILNIRG